MEGGDSFFPEFLLFLDVGKGFRDVKVWRGGARSKR